MSQRLGILAAASLIAVLTALTAFMLPGAFMARAPKGAPRPPETRRPNAKTPRPSVEARPVGRLLAVFAAAFIIAGFALGAVLLSGALTSSAQLNTTLSLDVNTAGNSLVVTLAAPGGAVASELNCEFIPA